MRSCALTTKAGRLAIFLLAAAFCLPALASFVYVPVSPTVVAQTADPQRLGRKVSEAPFGNFRTESHPGGDCGNPDNSLTCAAPYTFTGHLYDQESGLFYFGARYYDPETGRFLSQDPVAGDALNPPSLHKYLYAYSSPMNYTDPWGEWATDNDFERFNPSANSLDDLNMMKARLNVATGEKGAYAGLRGDFERSLKEGKAQGWNRDARLAIYGLFNKTFGASEAQDDRGFVVGENKPESLVAYDFKEGILQQIVDAYNDPQRDKKEAALRGDFLRADVSWQERAKVGAVASGAALLTIAAPEVLVGLGATGAVVATGVGAYGVGTQINEVMDKGWTEYSLNIEQSLEKPWLEGNSTAAAMQFGTMAGGLYLAARPPTGELAQKGFDKAGSFFKNFGEEVAGATPTTTSLATAREGQSALNRQEVLKGFQGHHIISDKNPLTKDHELLDLADFDLGSRANKMYLPSKAELHPIRSPHLGRHTTAVSRSLAQRMDQIVEVGTNEGWSKQQFQTALRALLSEERSLLRSGEIALNKNARPWAK